MCIRAVRVLFLGKLFVFWLKRSSFHPIIENVNSTIFKFQPRFRWFLAGVLVLSCSQSESWAFLNLFKKSSEVKGGYLSSQTPPKLRFHELRPSANRKMLHRLQSGNSPEVVEVSAPSLPETAFPIIAFDEPDTNASYELPISKGSGLNSNEGALPPTDPFVEAVLPDSNLNNTDELIQLLEIQSGKGSNRNYLGSEFIPPYTIESGNMFLQSESKYVRRVR
jgi:hypothetical protein